MKMSEFSPKSLGHADYLVLNLEVTLVLAGLVCIVLNALTFRYTGEAYLSFNWFWLAPMLFAVIFFSSACSKIPPSVGLLLKNYSLYFLSFFAFLVMLDGVQYTPFPTVDTFLGAVDHALCIKETALMDWTYGHPILLNVMATAYHSVVAQWLLMPLLLFVLREQRQFHFYLVTSLLAYLIGAGIYYFFPTVGPAGIFNDPHFTHAQMDIVLSFKQVHQYLMVTTFDGGMIAFPSFHVLWAVISIYILRNTSKALFIPILCLNLSAIAATLCLGWNYAADITCGILVAIAAIYLTKRLLRPRLASASASLGLPAI